MVEKPGRLHLKQIIKVNITTNDVGLVCNLKNMTALRQSSQTSKTSLITRYHEANSNGGTFIKLLTSTHQKYQSHEISRLRNGQIRGDYGDLTTNCKVESEFGS